MSSSPFNPITGTPADDSIRNISSVDPRLSRTNYYDGRLLKASDLIRDQLYLDERLREVGRALGQGIVGGLDVSLTLEGRLEVSAGSAVAPSGRVLELRGPDPLSINLYDSARIAALNPGFRYFQRGLYIVTLQYAEQGSGSAEAYPRDLEADRGFHFNAFAEGVEVTLTPMRAQSPMQLLSTADRTLNTIAPRAALERQLLFNAGQPPELDSDSVALGLVAIENGRALWLDRGLVRRPHRLPDSLHLLQQDMHAHYQEMLAELLQLRQESGRHDIWPAKHYFDLLPPFGSLPETAVDPVQGRQTYFPEGFDVSIAPVREDELPAVLAQSAALETIDLARDEDVDIMVLAVLSDHDFGWRARQLQRGGEVAGRMLLPHFDSLALRLYGRQPVFDSDSADANVWRNIMAAAKGLHYVRRPTRVAETQVSAVVLASGYQLPEVSEIPPDLEPTDGNTASLEEQLAALKAENKKLQAKLDAGGDAQLSEAKAKIEAQGKTIDSLNGDLDKAKAQLEAVTKDRDALQKTLDAANATIAKLKAQLKQLDPLKEKAAKADELAGQLKTATANRDKLQAQLTKSNAQIVKLQKETENLDALKAKAKEADKYASQLKSLSASGTAMQKQLATVKKQLDALQKAAGNDSPLTVRIGELNKNVLSAQKAAGKFKF